DRRALAEAGDVGVLTRLLLPPPGMVGPGDALDLLFGQLAVRAAHHDAHLPGVDEEHLAPPVPVLPVVTVPGEEPQAGRDLRRVEELPRERDHAVDQVCLDDVLPDFPLARLVRGHGAGGAYSDGDAAMSAGLDDVM